MMLFDSETMKIKYFLDPPKEPSDTNSPDMIWISTTSR